MKNLKWLLVLAALVVMPFASQAQVYGTNTVTLAWDASPSLDITNYCVYYGNNAGGPYPLKKNASTALTTSVSTLTNGVSYYFVATAQDKWGLESDFSNEVTYTVPRLKPVPPGQLRKTNP
jgi:fibronectin type 3 domain-containing protein